jgi:glycosyltransferase involved in cell wall biosynthesis
VTRVLSIIASTELGGAERVFTALLDHLDRRRFETWVACSGTGPMLAEYAARAAGVRSFDLERIWDPRTVLALARWMRALRCDVVHTHLWTADVLGGLAAALARVPVRVATVHTEYFRAVDEVGTRRARKALLSRLHRVAYHLFDVVIAVSHSVARDLAQRPGVPVSSRRIRVIQNGIDAVHEPSMGTPRETLGLPPGTPVVLVPANFVPMKGHRWLVDAVPGVLERAPGATFLLAGTGPTLASVRARIASAGLDARVRVLGSRGDMLELMRLADLVVLPSVAAEGLPIACLEAMLVGRPVVAAAVGGLPEVVDHGRTGLLVPPRDPASLTEAITALLADPARALSMGEAGRAAAAGRFTAKRMAMELAAVYEALLQDRRIPVHAAGTARDKSR